MIRVSGPNMKKIAEAVNGVQIEGVTYTFTGKITGIQATFTTDAADEEAARVALKAYLKKEFPVYTLRVEVI